MAKVGPTEAGQVLGIDKSVVSRQAARFAEQGLLERDHRGRFDLDAYRALRDGDLDPTKQGNHAGLGLGEAPASASASIAPAGGGGGDQVAPSNSGLLLRARTAQLGVQARLASLTLAEREGRLVPIDVVEQREAEMLSRIDRGLRSLRQMIMAIPRQLQLDADTRAKLDARIRQSLEAFDAESGAGGPAAGEPGPGEPAADSLERAA